MPVTRIPVDARPVALARVCLAVGYLVCLIEVVVVLSGVSRGKLAYPVSELLPAVSPSVVTSLTVLGLLAGVFLLLGMLSGLSAGVAVLVLLLAQLLDQQTYSNHLVLCTLLLGYLSLARSGSRWSLDARLRSRHATVPWWPQLLMMSQVSVCYLFAGLSKINPVFLSGETLPQVMWLEAPGSVFQALAVATICVEIFIAVGLWLRSTRVLAVLAGIGLHSGIVIGFDGGAVTFIAFALLCVATYWMFLVRPQVSRARGVGVERPAGAPQSVHELA